MDPSELPKGASKRLPSLRTGKGSASGEMPAAGFPTGEMSWVLENNVMMNRAAELIGGRRSKTYRIYEMPA